MSSETTENKGPSKTCKIICLVIVNWNFTKTDKTDNYAERVYAHKMQK